MPTKAQGRRSSKEKSYYAEQYKVTERNKERRAQKRAKKIGKEAVAKEWRTKKR